MNLMNEKIVASYYIQDLSMTVQTDVFILVWRPICEGVWFRVCMVSGRENKYLERLVATTVKVFAKDKKNVQVHLYMNAQQFYMNHTWGELTLSDELVSDPALHK